MVREASKLQADIVSNDLDGKREVNDVVCTACGCVCDDLKVSIHNQQIVEVMPTCAKASVWFESVNRPKNPPASIEGQAVDFEKGVERAAEILAKVKSPLIFGLSRSSTEGQRQAIQLAEWLGGTVDTTASICHGPSILAIQNVGEATCSLGEVRHRSDLVLFWRADPEVSHPRHLERYSAEPIGEFIPNGREDRRLIVLDQKVSETSAKADAFYELSASEDLSLIWRLRSRLKEDLANGRFADSAEADRDGKNTTLNANVERIKRAAGAPPRLSFDDLYEALIQCRYGVVFFGLGLAQSGFGSAFVEGLLELVAELNQVSRFSARRLRLPGDVAGADSVLCWMTGYPFAVNFARGYPRFGPDEYTISALLERQETDCCLIVGTESLELMPSHLVSSLQKIPTIVLDYPHVRSAFEPTVKFSTAIYGVHRSGTAYRMDEVPLPLKAFLPSALPSDDEVLQVIATRLKERDVCN